MTSTVKFLQIARSLLSGRKPRTGENIIGTGDYMFALAPESTEGKEYASQKFPDSAISSSVNATPAIVEAGVAGTYSLSHGMTLDLVVDGVSWTVTFSSADFADIANATAAEIGLKLTSEGIGVVGYQTSGKLYIKTESVGESATLQVTGGTANAVLLFALTEETGGNEFHAAVDCYTQLIGWTIGDYAETSQDIDLTSMDAITGSFRGSCDESLQIEQWLFTIVIDGEIRAARLMDGRDLTLTDLKAPVPDITSTVSVTFRLQLVPGADFDLVLTPSMEVDLGSGTRGYTGTTIYTLGSFGGIPTLQYWWILLFGHNVHATWWDTQGNSGDLGVVSVVPLSNTLVWTGATPGWVSGGSERVFLTLRPYTECGTTERTGLFVASDGMCLELDGTDAYVEVADSSTLDVGDEFAIFLALKPLNSDDRYLVYREQGGVVGYALRTDDGDLSLYYECDGESIDSGLSLDTDWNSVCVIIDNTDLLFIVFNDTSGLQVAAKTRTKVTPTQTASLLIGTDGVDFLAARMEKVALWTEKLSQANGEDTALGVIPATGDLVALLVLTRGTGTNIRDFSLCRNHGILNGSGYSWENDAPETYGYGVGTPDKWN